MRPAICNVPVPDKLQPNGSLEPIFAQIGCSFEYSRRFVSVSCRDSIHEVLFLISQRFFSLAMNLVE